MINSANQDIISYSETCTLKIINCYKSCNECDDIGNTQKHNCLSCKLDNDLTAGEDPYYFLEDASSKICMSGDIDFYYLDNANTIYKKCYQSCKMCTQSGTIESHNCLECYQGKRYFPFEFIINGADTLYNCFLDLQPPDGYYFNSKKNLVTLDPNEPYFKQCNGNCLKCDQDLVETSADYFCKICDKQSHYYAKFQDDDSKKYAQCLNELPENYFLDEPAGRYRKCYPSCKTCSKSGNDEFNNCDTCKDGLQEYSINQKTCKCEYNFYYKLDSNDNFISFECTEDLECPNEYQYLLINSQNLRQCLKSCPKEHPYIYNNQCFNHKLNGTSYEDGNYQGSDNNNINTDNTQCILNDYITSTIPKQDISKATKDYVINYINEYSKSNEYDYTYNHANLIRNDNEDYMLLIFQNDNCLKKIKDEYGLNFIDLTEYSSEIKSANDINQNEPLTYAFLYTDSEDVNVNDKNIDYDCYNSKTGDKLDLDDILKDKKITKNMSPPDGNKLKKLQYLSKYAGLGIDFSDPNSEFFNSQCFQFSSDKGKDVTLADRRKYFFNNIKICEDECVFNGIDEKTNTVKCKCPYKKGSTSIINKNMKFPDYNEEYFIYDMWKCLSKDMVKPKELKKSYITIILFCLFILAILFTILYFVFLKNKFQFLSKFISNIKTNNTNNNTNSLYQSIKNDSNKNISISEDRRSKTVRFQKTSKDLVSNPPPKNENEKGSESTQTKEKGYVKDSKRPFNYDSNNLYFHADENYTIGSQNLNSLFMGQNFKNDYSKEIAQYQNEEKKPKENIINNYNNINIPGKRLNKKNKTAFTRINNFNNINYSSNLFKIDEETPNPLNKNSNNLIYPKNDLTDGNSTDLFRSEDSKKKSKIPLDKTSIDIIPEINNEEQIDEDMKNAKGEIGEENMELNILDFDSAKKIDVRNFCDFYFNQLKHRQIFLYTGYFHSLGEGTLMKILIIFFHILICLFFNLFWYRTSYVHDEFISIINNHAKFSSKYAWFRIMLSVICYIIVICLLHLIYLPQLKIYYTLIDEKLGLNEKKEIIKKKIKCMKINYLIFSIINLCFFVLLILYVLVFSYVFINSKTDLMISFIITFLLTQALPFIFVFFVTCFRFIGIKCNSTRLYKFSLFFTI